MFFFHGPQLKNTDLWLRCWGGKRRSQTSCDIWCHQTWLAGHVWVNLITTSLRPSPGIMVNRGNHPQMAARFRLVKYDFIYPDMLCHFVQWCSQRKKPPFSSGLAFLDFQKRHVEGSEGLEQPIVWFLLLARSAPLTDWWPSRYFYLTKSMFTAFLSGCIPRKKCRVDLVISDTLW